MYRIADANMSLEDKQKVSNEHSVVFNSKTGGYNWDKNGVNQLSRLEEAKKIDEEAAIKSCSWGRFQIMGEYYTKDSSYPDYKQFEEAINMCELQHLSYFKTFIKKSKRGTTY